MLLLPKVSMGEDAARPKGGSDDPDEEVESPLPLLYGVPAEELDDDE